ncbi:MAG: tRNA lysidine(34) synthetase TilS, partial [Actinomycetota bacterium]
AGEGLPTVDDVTNRDLEIRRVRVREEVLPALARIAPDPVGSLTRLADLIRDDAATLDATAAALPDAIRQVGSLVALRFEALADSPPALARRLVRAAFARIADQPPSATTVARILDTPVGAGATLPGGVELRVERAWRTLEPPDPPPASASTAFLHSAPQALDTSGHLLWSPAQLRLAAATPGSDPALLRAPRSGDTEPPGPIAEQIPMPLTGLWVPPEARIDPLAAAPGTIARHYGVLLPALTGLVVRHIAAGDRIATGVGNRRVVEVLRDAGVPRAVRRRWPLVTSPIGEVDRVVWIPGIAVDAGLAAVGRVAPALALRAWPAAGGTGRPHRYAPPGRDRVGPPETMDR